MKLLTTHHDSFPLNASILVAAVDDPRFGASHRYEFSGKPMAGNEGVLSSIGFLQFQKGPRGEIGSTHGVTEAAVLAVLIDRVEDFQKTEYRCEENAHIVRHLREALDWTKRRAVNRAKRGVLGKERP